ncbi:MAG: putative ABC transporter permease [Clostridium sp.]|nr:putative ABC transporter permease [Clostridium sp.]
MHTILVQFVYFVLYSFLGWMCETIYCSIDDKKFVNRGFLNGPFCPIYGTGALLVIDIFMKYKDDLLVLFILSVVITSIVEYITSYLLEKIFNLQLWDYSTYSFNLNGRVCLKNSLLFGVLSILAVEVIHPAVEGFLSRLPVWFLITFTGTLVVYFICDVVITVKALIQINKKAGHRQMQLDELAKLRNEYIAKNKKEDNKKESKILQLIKEGRIRELLKEEKIKAFMTEEKLKELMDVPNKFVHRRVIKAFPGMKSKKYPDAIKQFKKEIGDFKKKRKS